jgi:hypothetical protein
MNPLAGRRLAECQLTSFILYIVNPRRALGKPPEAMTRSLPTTVVIQHRGQAFDEVNERSIHTKIRPRSQPSSRRRTEGSVAPVSRAPSRLVPSLWTGRQKLGNFLGPKSFRGAYRYLNGGGFPWYQSQKWSVSCLVVSCCAWV